MMQLVPNTAATLPSLAAAGKRACASSNSSPPTSTNPHTRRAHYRAAQEFVAWCSSIGLSSIAAVEPMHVATSIELGTRELSAPSVKQRLAALHHLFDWLVIGHVVPINPAYGARAAARGDLRADAGA